MLDDTFDNAQSREMHIDRCGLLSDLDKLHRARDEAILLIPTSKTRPTDVTYAPTIPLPAPAIVIWVRVGSLASSFGCCKCIKEL